MFQSFPSLSFYFLLRYGVLRIGHPVVSLLPREMIIEHDGSFVFAAFEWNRWWLRQGSTSLNHFKEILSF